MTRLYVDLVGEQATLDRLRGIGERAMSAKPVFEEIAHVLEEGEKRVFQAAGGRYVRTGALRASLTQPDADQAIRAAHADGQGLTFGTGIWYAHFQKTAQGKSAVLKLTPAERKQAKKLLLEWLVGGHATV